MLFVLRFRSGVHGTLYRASLLRVASAVNADLRRGPERPVGWARDERIPGATPRASALPRPSPRLLSPGGIRSGYTIIDRPVRSDRSRRWPRPPELMRWTRLSSDTGANVARCVIYFVYISVVSPSSPCRVIEIVQARFRSVMFWCCIRTASRVCRERFSSEVVKYARIPDIEVLGYILNV